MKVRFIRKVKSKVMSSNPHHSLPEWRKGNIKQTEFLAQEVWHFLVHGISQRSTFLIELSGCISFESAHLDSSRLCRIVFEFVRCNERTRSESWLDPRDYPCQRVFQTQIQHQCIRPRGVIFPKYDRPYGAVTNGWYQPPW
jgi:hypothetical protein